jgi:hypothetical protein
MQFFFFYCPSCESDCVVCFAVEPIDEDLESAECGECGSIMLESHNREFIEKEMERMEAVE